MDKQSALKALGLADNASETDIAQAIAAKKRSIADKQASAPTDALKAKFATMAKKLADIEQALSVGASPAGDSPSPDKTPSPAGATSRAPLSQTKLADLPGMAPQDAAQVELQPGQILANRYEIKELIGQGGMGAVYRAHDKNRDEDIAIKLLLPSLTKNERALERFLNEARISSKLSHPNIVNVFDVQNDGDLYFLIMELLEGQDLRQIMDNQKAAGRPFDVEDVKEYIAGITEGLAYAHQHTVHRDIKPENIWVTEDQQVKLMDFGIAQLQSTSQRTQTGAAMGTAYYMAPEQLKGVKDIDGRADQYALGVLAYEMLTEEVPAGVIEPVNALRKDIPKGMAAAIMQAMNARPENRFADINAFNAAVQSGKGAKKTRAPKAASPANPHLSSGPNKLAIAGMVLLLVVGIGVAAQQGWLDGLKPLDKELIAQQKADAAKLQGEIKTLKRRFDNAVRDLDSDIRDAERDKNSKEEQRLQAWMDLAKRYLVDSARYGELEGLESQADLHLRDEKQSAQAVAVLEQARDGYKNLVDDFYAGENVSVLSPQTAALRKQWQGKQGSKAWPVSEKVEALYQQARANEADGLLRDAGDKFTELKSGYTALIAANDDMVNVNQSLKQAQAAWQKLAASKKLTNVPEIEALKKEEQQLREALKAAAELAAVTAAMEGLQGQITTYKELTRSVANLAQAEKNALSAKASYEKQRKGYPLDDNATANKAGEQLTAAQAALKNKQWVAAGKGFADAKAGYGSARSTESKVIANINHVWSEKKKAQETKVGYEKTRNGYPLDDNAAASKAGEQLAAAQAALKNKQWEAAGEGFADATAGYERALSAESKVIAIINQARTAREKAYATQASYNKIKERHLSEEMAVEAHQALVVGDKALADRSWGVAESSFVEAAKGFVEAEAITSVIASMVEIRGGRFSMGLGSSGNTAPSHEVKVPPFYIQEHEVTWSQYQPCIDAGVCPGISSEGWGKGSRPVINVSWHDVQKYLGWLRSKTGLKFRLPSESEWEYVGGIYTVGTLYPTYDEANIGSRACCKGRAEGRDQWVYTSPVKSFPPNSYGLYDTYGNVSEWVQDCYHHNYIGAPTNGEARVSSGCERRVLRGGSWIDDSNKVHVYHRKAYSETSRHRFVGFRLARDL